MFTHLLVPLDGSTLSEVALPAAVYLGRTLAATITLLHVLEHNPPQEIHGERHLITLAEADHYLETTMHALPVGLVVDYHTHPNQENNVARSIVDHARELGVDLIVMCTHGRGSLRRWLFGTIAQKVIALGETPVLLIRPPESGLIPAFTCRSILTPLDGDPAHEAGLAVATELAQACSASLHLLMVVPTPGTLPGEGSATARLLPATTAAVLNLSQQDAADYLKAHMTRTAAQGLAVTAEVRRGEPAPTIARAAREEHADLIVMATHGKSHLDAFWSGSVSPKVSDRSHLPLLLVPVLE